MADKEEVFIRCSRCEDLPDPGVESTKDQCCTCGQTVWVAPSSRAMVTDHYPGHAMKTICMNCVVDDGHRAVALPEQVQILRAYGYSDGRIAYTLAIAEVAGGTASLEAAQADIAANPSGERAKAFPEALRRAALLIAATDMPSN